VLILLTGVGREGQVGELVARAFAERGATVLLVDRQAAQAEARARALTDQGHRASAAVISQAPTKSASSPLAYVATTETGSMRS
jgi:NAD(P)-dependent dehydrogenase (short-subunit alcohol dehydrogenase family)